MRIHSFLNSVILCIFIGLYFTAYSYSGNNNSEKYYIAETSKYIFCINENLEKQWTLRIIREPHFFTLLYKGYLILIDSNKYKIINIKTGDVLYEKSLAIFPNGYTEKQDGNIIVNSGKKTETFSIFPPNFKENYLYAYISPDKCYKPHLIIGTSIPNKSELRINYINGFIFAFSGDAELLWNIKIPEILSQSKIASYYNFIIYGINKELIVLKMEDGKECGKIDLPGEIDHLFFGKIAYVFLKNGNKISVDEQLSKLKCY